MSDPIMKKVRGNGINIQLAQWGKKGPTILCVHGLTANCRCWDRIAAPLEKTNTVLAMDLRGRGLSDKPAVGHGIEQHVQDIRCLLDDLGLTTVVLLGHSLGAYIALAFAARYTDASAGLILLDGGAQLSHAQWGPIELALKPSIDRLEQFFPTYEDYVAPLKKIPFLQPWSPFLDTYFEYETEETENGVRSRTPLDQIRKEIAKIRQVDAAGLHAKIACPALILRATTGLLSPDDRLLPETNLVRMLQAMPGSRRIDLAGTNHFSILFGDNPKRDQAIQAFLK